MKKIFIFILLIITLTPANLPATNRSVTIYWTMPSTTGIIGYKIYYSFENNMNTRILAGQTNETNSTSLTCDNVPIDTYPIYFTVSAITIDKEISSSIKTVDSPIKEVQGFTLTTLTND